MKITEITMHRMNMRMKNPFTTSFGTEQDREFIILEAKDEDGTIGWGECVTSESPLYIEEFTKAAWVMLEEYLIPLTLGREFSHPDELTDLFEPFKRNNLAKAAIDAAAGIFMPNSKVFPWHRQSAVAELISRLESALGLRMI